MSSLPSTTVVPTTEEIEFALLVTTECNGNVAEAARKTWPTLKTAHQKGYNLTKKPGYQSALEVIKERTKHEVRAILEANNAGEKRRLEIVAAVINGSGGPTCGERLKYIEHADKREGRAEEKSGVSINVFTAVATGNGPSDPYSPDTGFCGVRTAVSIRPDQDGWPSAVSSMADAGPSGTGTDTP